MAPWLLRYPRYLKRALQFSLCFLIKLYLASHPVASGYSRVTVSSFLVRPCRLGSVNVKGTENKMLDEG